MSKAKPHATGNFSPPGSTPTPRRAPAQLFAPVNFWMGLQFAPSAVRQALPAGLVPVPEATGGFGVQQLTDARGTAQIQASIYLDVDGFDAPDGRPGRYTVWACYGPADAAAGESRGSAAFSVTGDAVSGELILGPAAALRFAARADPARTSGNIRFALNMVSVDADGRIVTAAIPTFIGRRVEATPLTVRVEADAAHPLAWLRPTGANWAALNHDVHFAIGLPAMPRDPGGDALKVLFARLDQSGRGAVLVEGDRVAAMNPTARRLLSDPGDAAWRGGQPEAGGLTRLLVGGLRQGTDDAGGHPFPLHRQDGLRPLLAVAIPWPTLAAAPAGARTLVLITDPERPAHDPGRAHHALQLLGLTPFEAKVAARAATGIARRSVASQLALTEATVRVTMSVVYQKLGVSRQSELARLVSQLEPLG